MEEAGRQSAGYRINNWSIHLRSPSLCVCVSVCLCRLTVRALSDRRPFPRWCPQSLGSCVPFELWIFFLKIFIYDNFVLV